MTPELLAMIKDVKPVSDEEIALLLRCIGVPCDEDQYNLNGTILSLIARIVAERKEWQDIRDTPKSGHYLLFGATRHDLAIRFTGYIAMDGRWYTDAGELCKPTHWQPLPTPPALQSGETGND